MGRYKKYTDEFKRDVLAMVVGVRDRQAGAGHPKKSHSGVLAGGVVSRCRFIVEQRTQYPVGRLYALLRVCRRMRAMCRPSKSISSSGGARASCLRAMCSTTHSASRCKSRIKMVRRIFIRSLTRSSSPDKARLAWRLSTMRPMSIPL